MEPFASPQELNAWIQRDLPEEQGALALRVASGAIRARCGWSITEETVTVTRAWSGPVMWLPTLHLTEVSITVGDLTLARGAGFDWDVNGRVNAVTSWPSMGATITYTHGYPWPHPALDLAAAVCLSAASRAVDNPRGLRSFAWTTGGESETAVYAGGGPEVSGSALTSAERADLAPLVLPALA